MNSHSPSLELERHQAVRELFQRMPFNQALGIELDEISAEKVVMHLAMKEQLVGNFILGILHGGVIASVLDVAGGAIAMVGAIGRHAHLSEPERAERLSRLGTIDLRIDYLRPGRGQRFTATAVPLRSGNKVTVVRSELHNEQGTLVAVGTGTYLCG
nr:thioesterase family protein [Pseudomonas sp.]